MTTTPHPTSSLARARAEDEPTINRFNPARLRSLARMLDTEGQDCALDAIAEALEYCATLITPKVDQIAPWFGSGGLIAPGVHAMLDLHISSGTAQRKPHQSYWGLCCGGLSEFLGKPIARQETLIDLHPWLTHLIVCMTCDPWRLRERLRYALTSQAAYNKAIDHLAAADPSLFLPDATAEYDQHGGFSELDAQLAAAIFIAWWQGKGDTAGSKREGTREAFSRRWDSKGGTAATRFQSAIESMDALHARLRGVNTFRTDIFEALPRIADAPGESLYIDPPFAAEGQGDHYTHPFQCDPNSPSAGGLFAATPHAVPDQHDRLEEQLRRFQHTRVVVRYFDDPDGKVRRLYTRDRGWIILDCGHGKLRNTKTSSGGWSKPDLLITNAADQLIGSGRAGSAATTKKIESTIATYMRDNAPDCPYHGVIS